MRTGPKMELHAISERYTLSMRKSQTDKLIKEISGELFIQIGYSFEK